MKIEGFCFDIEADGFYLESTKIWTIVLKDLNDKTKKLKLNPFKDQSSKEQFLNWLYTYKNPVVAFHYGLGYDQFMIMKHLGIPFSVGPDFIADKQVTFIDTFYLSMYTNPDLDGHGIEAWGYRLGLEKIDYRQKAIDLGLIDEYSENGAEFKIYHPEMDIYCERDVDVNILVFWKLWDIFSNQYKLIDELPSHFKCGQKSFYLMSCQGFTGWKFDLNLANSLIEQITKEMEEIRQEVEPQLPARKLKKTEEKEYMMPMKPFKKDGTFSSHMLNFISKHSGIVNEDNTVDFYGKTYQVNSQVMLDVKLPMELGNQDDIKRWLLDECGWKPSFWNYKKDQNGKPIRDEKTRKLIPTTPKIQDQGKICPNLLELQGELVNKIVRWLSLRNRLAVLQGWVGNKRLEFDGRLTTDRTGITPTHRQKHSTVVNVPKASEKVLLGKEFRSLFISEGAMLIAAGDASALEGRVQGHYTYKYDNGRTADELLNGDPHSKNAKAFYPVETKQFDISSSDFNKDHPKFKPYRDRSKNGFYALLYGAGAPKLATTLGKPESEGNKLLEAFWKANPATASLKENVEKFWETKGEKKWIPGIDGRRIFTRKKSALLNSLFQSCGAIIMEYAACFLDKWLGGIKFDSDYKPFYIYKGCIVKRIGFYHDEFEFECSPDIAEEIAKMIEKAIETAGKHLKLSVPLAGEGKVGKNWCEVH